MSENTTNKIPLRIETTEPQKYEKLAATTIETTQRLAKRINKLFSTTFADYYGAVVTCNPGNGNMNQHMFMVELHFKPIPAGAVNPADKRLRAFKPVDEAKGDDLISGIKSIYGTLRTSAKYEMTSETSQVLSEFMLPGINVDPFNPKTYDNLKAEYVDQSHFGASPAMVRVAGLDLTKLVKKIYGDKSENDKKVDYGVIPYGPVVPNMNNPAVQNTANWRVIIMQIEKEKAFDLAAEFGLIPAGSGAGPVITGF